MNLSTIFVDNYVSTRLGSHATGPSRAGGGFLVNGGRQSRSERSGDYKALSK